jgi:hypothetical protein
MDFLRLHFFCCYDNAYTVLDDSFVMTTWLVDVLLLNVVDGYPQYREVLWI